MQMMLDKSQEVLVKFTRSFDGHGQSFSLLHLGEVGDEGLAQLLLE